MKRFNSIILSMAILLSSFAQTAFAEGESGWDISYEGTYAEENREDVWAGISEEYKFSGMQSMHIICTKGKREDENYINIKNGLKEALTAGEYTLSFYARSMQSWQGEIVVGDEVLDISAFTAEAATSLNGDENWKKYTVVFSYDGVASTDLSFRFYNRVRSLFIDNASLSLDEGENLISDPYFEEYYEGALDEEYDTTPYQATRLLASGGAGDLALSWVNPKTDELKKVSLYDMTNGDNLITDEISTEPEDVIIHRITGLAEGSQYQYKLVFEFDEKPTLVYFLSGTPRDADYYFYGEPWTFRRFRGGAAGFCPADIYIDSTTGSQNSLSSLKFVSNIDTSYEGMNSNIFIGAYFDRASMNFEPGKSYHISWDVKYENVKEAPRIYLSWNTFEDHNEHFPEYIGTSDGWERDEVIYNCATEGSALLFSYDRLCDAIWYDNIEVYEYDKSTGEKIGENLMIDGDFENLISENVGTITGLKAEPDTQSATLTWNIPEEDYAGAYIYQKVFDKYEYRGTVSSKKQSLTIDNLKMEKEYTYKLVPINAYKKEGEAQEITFKTSSVDYYVNPPKLYKDGSVVENITDAGEYVLKIDAKNNIYADGMPLEQLVAIYNGKTLERVYSSSIEVPKRVPSAPVTEISTTFEVPDGDDYRVMAYVMDKRTSLKLYHNPIILK